MDGGNVFFAGALTAPAGRCSHLVSFFGGAGSLNHSRCLSGFLIKYLIFYPIFLEPSALKLAPLDLK
jgi:hypothetical protein